MVKVIYLTFVFVVVSASLCFGQEGLLKTETKPSLMFGYGFHSPASVIQNNSQLQPLSFYTSYKKSFFNSFITNALIMQTEGETLQPKTSFWKQAGIYGLEFMGGSAGSCASLYISWLPWHPEKIPSGGEDIIPRFIGSGIYIVSNPLLTSGFTVFVAKMLNQRGSWKKALIGSCLGTIASFVANAVYYQYGSSSKAWVNFMFFTAITLPPTGAVVGYNL